MRSISTEFVGKPSRPPMEHIALSPPAHTRPRVVYDNDDVSYVIKPKSLALLPVNSMQPYVVTPGSPTFRKVSRIFSKTVMLSEPVRHMKTPANKKSDFGWYVVTFISFSCFAENNSIYCSNPRKSTLVNLMVAGFVVILALAITAIIVLSVLLSLKPADTSFTSSKDDLFIFKHCLTFLHIATLRQLNIIGMCLQLHDIRKFKHAVDHRFMGIRWKSFRLE